MLRSLLVTAATPVSNISYDNSFQCYYLHDFYEYFYTFQVSSMSNPVQPPPSMPRTLLTGAAPPNHETVDPLVPLGTPTVSNFFL